MKRKINAIIPTAIEKPFFLKKLINGPEIVDDIQATNLAIKLLFFNFFKILLSRFFCAFFLLIKLFSLINKIPRLNKIITTPKPIKVSSQ